jgi:ubiquinone/menaquinone biosynthesis C-methylase UbiE
MSKETSKSKPYRELYGDFDKYLHGKGLDIGGGPDPLVVKEGSVDVWDLSNGDGMLLDTIPNNKYDFVYSSHCLEHLKHIETALSNWVRIIKSKGFIYITVPDYETYEKNQWPSLYAGCPQFGHKHSFSINKKRQEVNRKNHFNIKQDLIPLLKNMGITPKEVRLELERYNFLLPNNVDQTTQPAIVQICIIGQKA